MIPTILCTINDRNLQHYIYSMPPWCFPWRLLFSGIVSRVVHTKIRRIYLSHRLISKYSQKVFQINVHFIYIFFCSIFSFRCNPETASVVLKLRNSLRGLLIKKALYPSPIEEDSHENKLIKYVKVLCTFYLVKYVFFLTELSNCLYLLTRA